MATQAVTYDYSVPTFGPVFSETSPANPKWFDRTGGMSSLSPEERTAASSDYKAYIAKDTANRLERFPTEDRYVGFRQGVRADQRTAMEAINEFAKGRMTLAGTLATARNADAKDLFFAVHKHIADLKAQIDDLATSGANANAAQAIEEHVKHLETLRSPLRTIMREQEIRKLSPDAWQRQEGGYAALSEKDKESARVAYESMLKRYPNQKTKLTVERFVEGQQKEAKRIMAKPVLVQTNVEVAYKPLPTSHWMEQRGGYESLQPQQKEQADKAYATAQKSGDKLAKRSKEEWVKAKQENRANISATIGRVSYAFANETETRNALRSIYGKENGDSVFKSVTEKLEPGGVKAAKIRSTFQLVSERFDNGKLTFKAVPLPGKVQAMTELLSHSKANENEQEKSSSSQGRQKATTRSRQRAQSVSR